MGKSYNSGNIAKHSAEYCQKFRGISLNIPWNALKHSLFITNNAVKGQAFKVNGRDLIMRRSFIYLSHCLQSICHRLKSTLSNEILLSLQTPDNEIQNDMFRRDSFYLILVFFRKMKLFEFYF